MNERRQVRAWTSAELEALDAEPLIGVAGARPDGTLRPSVLVGHVRLGKEELIRSLRGSQGAWYRAAINSGRGQVAVGSLRVDVAFIPDRGREDEVDRALRSRYGNDAGVRQMTRSPARESTLLVLPLF